MFRVKEVSERDSVARAEKRSIAENAKLPILKLIGTVGNEEVRLCLNDVRTLLCYCHLLGFEDLRSR